MDLIIHGHFYQPPRENPWTGKLPRQPSAAPHHDWNARVSSQCYAPNARSRVLDERGRIEEIVNNFEWINFDFGPTLLRWLEAAEPRLYRQILQADSRSRERNEGHGNAIAQAYNHTILPLASERDKRTQILWGLREFERRFGRPSESIWLPETAIDAETLRILAEFAIRYIILSPQQAKRFRPIGGGAWSDVSGGAIDPRRAYRTVVPVTGGGSAAIDVLFYDGPISASVSFERLLRNASGFADRLQAARGGAVDALVQIATDGEVYGHHEPFGDMCLAYLIAREAPLRGFRMLNYGRYLDLHPPQHEVEIDFGTKDEGTSWSCRHGIDRWRRDCGCSTGGQPGWNQKWRAPLRKGLERLQERLNEIYIAEASPLLEDPWEARDDYIEILLDAERTREPFLRRHASRDLPDAERRKLWRLLESQHQGMLMFTSCAWFFADIAGIEAQQNLTYAARAIDLAQPFTKTNLEKLLLDHLGEARSNIPEIGTGADVWRRFVRPARMPPERIALESAGLWAVSAAGEDKISRAVTVEIDRREGSLEAGRLGARVRVRDVSIDDSWEFDATVSSDSAEILSVEVRRTGNDPDRVAMRRSVDDFTPEARARVLRSLLNDMLLRQQERFDEIFESSRALIERYHGQEMILPEVFHALARDVIDRRYVAIAERLASVPPRELRGDRVRAELAEVEDLAKKSGVRGDAGPVARAIERALAANLLDPEQAATDDLSRSLDLLFAADATGLEIERTRLEEMVYALLSHHRTTVAARLAGTAAPSDRIDPDVLIRLAEHSNLSLRSFKGTRAHAARPASR